MSYKIKVTAALANAKYAIVKYGVPLEVLNVPVAFRRYRGKEKTYITFFRYNQQYEEFAENQPTKTCYYIQVDLWSDDPEKIEALEAGAETALKAAGFKGYNPMDLYEEDTGIYHIAIRINYTE